MPDRAFTPLLSGEEVAELRERFAAWPRQAEPRRDERETDLAYNASGQVAAAQRMEPGSACDIAEPRYDATSAGASDPPTRAEPGAVLEAMDHAGLQDPEREAEI